jgi:2-haloalkanoic acid dehalogenase type II
VSQLVTFDLYSAVIDSRTGGSKVFSAIAGERGWSVDGAVLYDEWDRRNKASQRDESEWITFAEHSTRALAATYDALDLVGRAGLDAEHLLESVGDWPLWPDVAEGLPALAQHHRVGVLSNVDDDIFARTAVAALVADDDVLTSERLRAYKPHPEMYQRARARAGGRLVHVATSARDVRGALEARIDVVRLRRPGHALDADGPTPQHEIDDLAQVSAVLERARETDRDSS